MRTDWFMEIQTQNAQEKKESLPKYLSTQIYYTAQLEMQLKINREKSKR